MGDTIDYITDDAMFNVISKLQIEHRRSKIMFMIFDHAAKVPYFRKDNFLIVIKLVLIFKSIAIPY